MTGGNSCLDEQIERLKRCEYLREGEVKALCLRAREILVDESNVQRVDAPVTVSFNHYLNLSRAWSYEYAAEYADQCYFHNVLQNNFLSHHCLSHDLLR
jgi:hypothetical protein